MKPNYTINKKIACGIKLLAFMLAATMALQTSAQVPMKFNYQAVARNTNGSPITSQSVGVRISLLSGSAGGNTVYAEHQLVTTNAFGVFSLAVGGGTAELGSMGNVSWTSGNIWMKVEMDVTGGNNYETMGTTELLSVPYAMVSGTAINGGGSGGSSGPASLDSLKDVSISNPVPGQVLKYDGSVWYNGIDNSGGGGNSLWNTSGNNMFNLNSGNVGVGTATPDALFDVERATTTGVLAHFKNSNAGNTGNVVSVENNGNGYNIYSSKTGSSEAVYLVKDNATSGTPNIYATNNGMGNTMDVFATGSGYAGNFRGSSTSPGALYASVTSSGTAVNIDGGAGGNALNASVSGNGYAGTFGGKMKVTYNCNNASVPHLALVETGASAAARMSFYNGSGGNYWQIAGMPDAFATNARFSLFYNGAENVTFTGDGNMGISNNTPTAKLHIVGSATNTNPILKIENNNITGSGAAITISSLGNGELITATKSGVGYGLNIQKTGIQSSAAAIYGSTVGSAGEGVRGSAFGAGGYGVYGNAAGTGSASYTGVYGYGSGSTGVDYGIYGQQGVGTNDYAGYFNGNLGYTGILSTTSDERLKNNIHSLDNGLNALMTLKPSKYEYRHDGEFAKMRLPEGEQIGLIAQDIEKVFPQLVIQTTFNSMEKNNNELIGGQTKVEYKSVNYIGLIPVLVKAIQEQQQEIADLQKQVKELQK